MKKTTNNYTHLLTKVNTINNYLDKLFSYGIENNLQDDAYLYALIVCFLRDIISDDLQVYKNAVLEYYNGGDINAISWSINDLFSRC